MGGAVQGLMAKNFAGKDDEEVRRRGGGVGGGQRARCTPLLE